MNALVSHAWCLLALLPAVPASAVDGIQIVKEPTHDAKGTIVMKPRVFPYAAVVTLCLSLLPARATAVPVIEAFPSAEGFGAQGAGGDATKAALNGPRVRVEVDLAEGRLRERYLAKNGRGRLGGSGDIGGRQRRADLPIWRRGRFPRQPPQEIPATALEVSASARR